MSYGGYPPQHGHSTPAPGQHPAPGYGAPPPQQGYGAPPPQQGYGAPPPQQGYGASPPQQGYRSPPPLQYGGGGYGGGYGQQAPGPGGFAGGPPPSAPPGADPQLWGWFTAVDTDRSGHISAHELQKALVNGDWTPFDLDTVKLLMTIFDTDRSGTIAFNEFAGLWKYIKEWQGVYKHFDKDRSGSIDGNELKEALSQFGYKLSPPLLSLLEKKYDVDQASAPSVPGQRGPPAGITFDRFVRACVVIRTLTEAFQKLDTDRDGWIQISYDQFMNTVLSAP